MRLLLVSDLHRDLEAARSIVDRAPTFDAVLIAGDLAIQREGLQEIVDVLSAIESPTILVCGNGESPEELEAACDGAAGGVGWTSARVLHGTSVELDGVTFFGLGGAVPVTPFGSWSYDIPEADAARLLAPCPDGAVLISHSPPSGHVDSDGSGAHHGSWSVLEAIERTHPRLVVCGHIHACWGEQSVVVDTPIVNAGPRGVAWTIAEG
ncbi:MAG: metallophosphoesterase family protein [Gemmatimonadota bacterium]